MEELKKNELKKVSMNLSDKSISNINTLSELIHENNRTRVVASALEIAKYILEKSKEGGGKLTIKNADGSLNELKLIL